MGSQRVRHDWATSLSFSLYIYWYICLGGGREHRVTAWDGRRAWSNKYSIWRYSTKLFFWSHVSYCPKWYQESSDPELFRWSVDSVSIDYFSLWSKFPVAGTWWTLPLVSYHAFTCFCIVVYYDLSQLSISVLWLHKTLTLGETGQKESKNTVLFLQLACTSKTITKIKTFLKVKCLLQTKHFLENMAYYAWIRQMFWFHSWIRQTYPIRIISHDGPIQVSSQDSATGPKVTTIRGW